jgi:type VI secretion system secreted protein Hcp
MAYEAYCAIKGNKQKQFKGESIKASRKDKWIAVLSFGMEIVSPRDAASGQASGKRQWKPIRIVKEWGAATPQILSALATNETLDEVNFEFLKVNPSGQEYVYQTIKLTNATISACKQYTGEGGDEGSSTAKHERATDTHELEAVSFTFMKIEMHNTDGKTAFIDDWQAQA